MREIKFRYNTPRGLETFTLEEISLGIPYSECRGQYTGLEDKNGKEIYEGDIVEVCKEGDFSYRDSDFCKVTQTDTGWALKGRYWYSIKEVEEVVGNIYENPEII